MHADKKIWKTSVTPEYIDLAAEILGMLSDPTRIKIVLALQQATELSVNSLAEMVGRRPSSVSQHLAKMRLVRMVTTRQEGTSVLYQLTDEHAVSLVHEAINQAEHAVANGQMPPHHSSPISGHAIQQAND